MTRRNRCLVLGKAVNREIPTPAGGVVIETFVPWKMVRRGVRKRIVTPLGEPEAFAGEARGRMLAPRTRHCCGRSGWRITGSGCWMKAAAQGCARSPRPKTWTWGAPVGSCG